MCLSGLDLSSNRYDVMIYTGSGMGEIFYPD